MRVTAFLRSYGDLYAVAVVFGMYSAVFAAFPLAVSPVVQIVFSYGTATCLAMWVCRDARSCRCTPCFDFGTFVFFTWIISVPGYFVAALGWRGLLIALTLVIAVFLSAAVTVMGFVLAGFVA